MIGRATASSSTRLRLFDGLFAHHDEAHQRLFRAVGQFLSQQRLEPTPANYAVAHAVVTGSDAGVVRAVSQATFGDMRLSQAAADEIYEGMNGSAAPAATPMRGGHEVAPAVGDASAAAASMAALVSSIDDARERFERYAGIVDTSRADAEAYGEALANEAATLAPASPAASGHESIGALLALTQSMIEKTRSAEEQLRVASTEMSELRVSLAAARQDAETDALTGLPNRRAFEAVFAEHIAGDRTPSLALAMCDIDRFKAVNDVHGHDIGDRVIRLMARELAQGCADATVARYGGEEFVVLFEGLDTAAAAALLDTTRAAISRRSFKVAGTGQVLDNLSFSGGVVSVAEGERAREAVRRADAALYRAKQNGRNRIELGD